MLTVSRHADQQTLLKAALLASVPVDAHDGAVLILKALFILDVLLDTPPEETLVERQEMRKSDRDEQQGVQQG